MLFFSHLIKLKKCQNITLQLAIIDQEAQLKTNYGGTRLGCIGVSHLQWWGQVCFLHNYTAGVRNVVCASVVIFNLRFPVAALRFPIFEANLKFLTGTSRFLLNFGVLG